MKRILGTGFLLGVVYVALSLASGVAWAEGKMLGRILVCICPPMEAYE